MKTPGVAASLLSLSLVAAACSKAADPPPERRAELAPAPAPASASAPALPAASGPSPRSPHSPRGSSPAAAAGEVTWEAPAAWQSVPNPTPMRKATYKIPKAAGDAEDAELAISAAAGGVDANIQRWAGQFGNAKPKVEPRSVGGLAVTVVELKGPFNGSMTMGAQAAPKDKQMLLGAIVDLGTTQQFFKLIGPEKTVTAARPDFDKLVLSLRSR